VYKRQYEETEKAWAKQKEKIMKGRDFYDPATKAKMNAFMNSSEIEIKASTFEYETDQRDAAVNKLLETRVAAYLMSASLEYRDPMKMQKSVLGIMNSIDKLGVRNDLPDEVVSQQIHEQVSAYHDQAIRGALSDQDVDAAQKIYLDAREKNQISGTHKTALKELLFNETLLKKVQADVRKYTIEGVTLEDALKAARDGLDGKEEKLTVAGIKEIFSERKFKKDEKYTSDERKLKQSMRDELPESQDLVSEAKHKYPNSEEKQRKHVKHNSSGTKRELAFKLLSGEISFEQGIKTREDSEISRREKETTRVAEAEAPGAIDDITGDSKTETEALEKAKYFSSKKRKLVEAGIRQHFAAKARDETKRVKALKKSGQEKFLKGEELTPEENVEIDSVPGYRERLQLRIDRAARGLPATSDEATRRELFRMYIDEKEKFSEIDLYGEKYGGKLSMKDQAVFEGYLVGMDKSEIAQNKSATKEAEKGETLAKAYTIAKPMLKAAGYKVTGKNENTDAFLVSLADQLADIPPDPKMSADERTIRMQNIVKGLLLQGETEKNMILNEEDIRAFESAGKFHMQDFEDENKEALDTLSKRSGVPRSKITSVVEAMIRLGLPTTSKLIKQVYDESLPKLEGSK
jgi:hypothetical protein